MGFFPFFTWQGGVFSVAYVYIMKKTQKIKVFSMRQFALLKSLKNKVFCYNSNNMFHNGCIKLELKCFWGIRRCGSFDNIQIIKQKLWFSDTKSNPLHLRRHRCLETIIFVKVLLFVGIFTPADLCSQNRQILILWYWIKSIGSNPLDQIFFWSKSLDPLRTGVEIDWLLSLELMR